MTWYAYHLFAEASPSLLEEFLASPVMSTGVYWVRDLNNYPWHDPRVKHELPPNGLLVIRPTSNNDKKPMWIYEQCSVASHTSEMTAEGKHLLRNRDGLAEVCLGKHSTRRIHHLVYRTMK